MAVHVFSGKKVINNNLSSGRYNSIVNDTCNHLLDFINNASIRHNAIFDLQRLTNKKDNFVIELEFESVDNIQEFIDELQYDMKKILINTTYTLL